MRQRARTRARYRLQLCAEAAAGEKKAAATGCIVEGRAKHGRALRTQRAQQLRGLERVAELLLLRCRLAGAAPRGAVDAPEAHSAIRAAGGEDAPAERPPTTARRGRLCEVDCPHGLLLVVVVVPTVNALRARKASFNQRLYCTRVPLLNTKLYILFLFISAGIILLWV